MQWTRTTLSVRPRLSDVDTRSETTNQVAILHHLQFRPRIAIKRTKKARPGYHFVTIHGKLVEVRDTPTIQLDNRSDYLKLQDAKYAERKKELLKLEELDRRTKQVTNALSPAHWVGAVVAKANNSTDRTFMGEVINGPGLASEQFARDYPTLSEFANFGFDLSTPFLTKGFKSGMSFVGKQAVQALPLGPGLYVDALLWDGKTIQPSYFNSPWHWYRKTQSPEIGTLREIGHNITTRDALDMDGFGSPSNNFRMGAYDLGLTSRDGYWYLPRDKTFGLFTKAGSAHGNTALAAKGELWSGGTSKTQGFPSYVIEGNYQPSLYSGVGQNRSLFRLTDWEDIPQGHRVGFHTGEMTTENGLSAFRKNSNGTYTDEGPILQEKRMVLTPTGELSDFTLDLQRFVRSPQFKLQFGDWENDPQGSSKILTSKGEPMMVYHGTDVRFKTFDPSKFRYGAVGEGFYVGRGGPVFNDKPVMLKGFANSKKPLRLTDAQRETMFEDPIWEGKSGPTPMDIQQLGYDGVLVNYGKTPMSDFELVVYDPKQFILFKKGGLIYIKEKNKGKFTASAKKAGLSVLEYAKTVLSDPNATTLLKKRANFARNAKKWKH